MLYAIGGEYCAGVRHDESLADICSWWFSKAQGREVGGNKGKENMGLAGSYTFPARRLSRRSPGLPQLPDQDLHVHLVSDPAAVEYSSSVDGWFAAALYSRCKVILSFRAGTKFLRAGYRQWMLPPIHCW